MAPSEAIQYGVIQDIGDNTQVACERTLDHESTSILAVSSLKKANCFHYKYTLSPFMDFEEQALCNQFSKISVSSVPPVKALTQDFFPKANPSPLLELPSELLPIICSFLSFKELVLMNYVCKATVVAAKNEEI
jgi:hypothetical protein